MVCLGRISGDPKTLWKFLRRRRNLWARALKPMIIYRLGNPKILSMCPRRYIKAEFQGRSLLDFLAQPPNRSKATMKFEYVRR